MTQRFLTLTPKRVWAGFKYRVGRHSTRLVQALRDMGSAGRAALPRCLEGAWPGIWWLIRTSGRALPREGFLRRAYTGVVFTRPWNRWYRYAYIPEHRDRFFEYLLTFCYEYPVQKKDVVVQIGASFGEETARFARAVGTGGLVVAIEPEPRNIRSLQNVFRKDEYPQVRIIPKGAGNVTGTARFHVGGEREHRLADIPGELTYDWWGVEDHLAESRYAGTITVPVDTVDNMLSTYSLDRIDFILVETNGSELEVVQGMERTLAVTRRLGVRGHVKRDGVPINLAISAELRNRGFETSITSEGMVLARRKGL